jgi:hypothetical protein
MNKTIIKIKTNIDIIILKFHCITKYMLNKVHYLTISRNMIAQLM